MSTALPVNLAGGPAAVSAPASPPGDSTASGAVQGSADGGFQGMLEQRMQASGPSGASSEQVDGHAGGPLQETGELVQGLDTNALAIAADPVVGLIDMQWLPGKSPANPPAAVDGVTLQLSLSRDLASDLASEWRNFAADSGHGNELSAGAGGDADTRLQAAISADFGKRLPQLPAEFAGAVRALVTDAAVLERARSELPITVASGDPAGSVQGLAGNATAVSVTAGAGEARLPATRVATPFGRPEWATAMNERVTWLIGQRVQSADIQINPPQLGPVEVRISIHNDQASVLFSSNHAVVRETLQAALPRLAELLQQSGITLGQASVGADSFAGQQHPSQDPRGQGRDSGGAPLTLQPLAVAADGELSAMRLAAPLRGRVGVDMFV